MFLSQNKATDVHNHHSLTRAKKETISSPPQPSTTKTTRQQEAIKTQEKNQQICSETRKTSMNEKKNYKVKTRKHVTKESNLNASHRHSKVTYNNSNNPNPLSTYLYPLLLVRDMFKLRGLGINGNRRLAYHLHRSLSNCHGNRIFHLTFHRHLRFLGNQTRLHGNRPMVLNQWEQPHYLVPMPSRLGILRIPARLFLVEGLHLIRVNEMHILWSTKTKQAKVIRLKREQYRPINRWQILSLSFDLELSRFLNLTERMK